ncbi:MAG: hypothetical protein EHM51_01895 [Geobacter sp.]|nr:MAG: hypothetical protein EHM51_01895 [Geobacter sp.]
MKLNIKAALLSAFVLPGLGQLYKGARVKGGIIILVVNLFLMVALFLVFQGMGELLVTANLSGIAAAEKVIDGLREGRGPAVRYILAAFSALWVYGIVDALIAGKNGKD